MQENWQRIFAWVLVHEGGYVDHPKDPGGATNFGVTQRVYAAWRAANGHSDRHVRNIAQDEVGAIYEGQYWSRVQGDALPSGVDYAVYDYAINSGVAWASKELQRAVGVPADGAIGPLTLAAIKTADPVAVIRTLCERRIGFMRRIRHRNTNALLWPTFGKGWSRRVMGERDGVQAGDFGVIDRAVMLAKQQAEIPAPQVRDDGAGAKAQGLAKSTAKASLLGAAKDPRAIAAVGTIAAGSTGQALLSPPMAYFVGAALVIGAVAFAWWLMRETSEA